MSNEKKFDVKIILGKDKESVKKVDVNGKIYTRRRNETYQHFMARVAQKKGNGMPFLEYMKKGHYYGYTEEEYQTYVVDKRNKANTTQAKNTTQNKTPKTTQHGDIYRIELGGCYAGTYNRGEGFVTDIVESRNKDKYSSNSIDIYGEMINGKMYEFITGKYLPHETFENGTMPSIRGLCYCWAKKIETNREKIQFVRDMKEFEKDKSLSIRYYKKIKEMEKEMINYYDKKHNEQKQNIEDEKSFYEIAEKIRRRR